MTAPPLPRCDGGVVSVVVLVEGESDRVALHTLARCAGRDLDGEGVLVVTMGGITNIRAHALWFGPRGLGATLRGLYDAPDEAWVRRGLAAAGVAVPDGDLASIGFQRCTDDLEDELIRAVGAERVEHVVQAQGELRSLDLLAGMPAQQGWSREALLHRFIGVRAGRKARYARLLVEAAGPDGAPAPLVALAGRP